MEKISYIIGKKIDMLQEYLEKLSPYMTLSTEELLENEEKRAAMERWFQLMVDEALDINAIITFQLGGRIAESYKSTFLELVPLKILKSDFVERISDSAKIRNQMTHDYDKLSKKDLIEGIKKYTEMYKTYTKILVEKFLDVT